MCWTNNIKSSGISSSSSFLSIPLFQKDIMRLCSGFRFSLFILHQNQFQININPTWQSANHICRVEDTFNRIMVCTDCKSLPCTMWSKYSPYYDMTITVRLLLFFLDIELSGPIPNGFFALFGWSHISMWSICLSDASMSSNKWPPLQVNLRNGAVILFPCNVAKISVSSANKRSNWLNSRFFSLALGEAAIRANVGTKRWYILHKTQKNSTFVTLRSFLSLVTRL